MSEGNEFSRAALVWAFRIVSAFRKSRGKKGGYTTASWERKTMSDLINWASAKAESQGDYFDRGVVEKIHNVLLFKELNASGQASQIAQKLASFYRAPQRPPQSSVSHAFRRAVNETWRREYGCSLADLYSSHIEYNIVCQVVYDLFVRQGEKLQPHVATSALPDTAVVDTDRNVREEQNTTTSSLKEAIHYAQAHYKPPHAVATCPDEDEDGGRDGMVASTGETDLSA
jgi:hypothetical protein